MSEKNLSFTQKFDSSEIHNKKVDNICGFQERKQ